MTDQTRDPYDEPIVQIEGADHNLIPSWLDIKRWQEADGKEIISLTLFREMESLEIVEPLERIEQAIKEAGEEALSFGWRKA